MSKVTSFPIVPITMQIKQANKRIDRIVRYTSEHANTKPIESFVCRYTYCYPSPHYNDTNKPPPSTNEPNFTVDVYCTYNKNVGYKFLELSISQGGNR